MPPATSEDVGKTVVVNENGKYELAEASIPLPVPVLPGDVGKAIIVDENGDYTLAEAGGADVETIVVYISYPTISSIPTTGKIIGYKDKNKTQFTNLDYDRLYDEIKSNSVRFIIMLDNEPTDNANMIFPTQVQAYNGNYMRYINVDFIQNNNGTLASHSVTVYSWEN